MPPAMGAADHDMFASFKGLLDNLKSGIDCSAEYDFEEVQWVEDRTYGEFLGQSDKR